MIHAIGVFTHHERSGAAWNIDNTSLMQSERWSGFTRSRELTQECVPQVPPRRPAGTDCFCYSVTLKYSHTSRWLQPCLVFIAAFKKGQRQLPADILPAHPRWPALYARNANILLRYLQIYFWLLYNALKKNHANYSENILIKQKNAWENFLLNYFFKWGHKLTCNGAIKSIIREYLMSEKPKRFLYFL